MEDQTIRVIHLIYELKRNLTKLIVIGLIGALVACAFGVVKTKKAIAGTQYGSSISVQIRNDQESILDDSKVVVVDMSDYNKALLAGDKVIERTVNNLQASYPDITSADVRKSILIQGKSSGNIMLAYVVSDSQEKANALCTAFEAAVKKELSTADGSIQILQSTYDMGAVSIENKTDTSNPEKKYAAASATSVPSLGAKTFVKYGGVGFIALFCLAYLVVCAVYVIKGKIKYEAEITDLGISSLGTFNMSKPEDSSAYTVGQVVLCNRDYKKIKLLAYGLEEASVVEKALNTVTKEVQFKATENILTNPMARLDVKKDEPAIMIVKSGSMKAEDLWLEKQHMEQTGINLIGALIVEK